ncbi:hypothetical protein [Calothrix sp. 336/3]|uniref:hypothetical protein n=1 Tax=Calothrix sp. 336/3 TaxID=1337936 RepID=UPI0004E3FD51|nr:hypothetical protein [Calothrix sp. 336/3]AKG21249.1 hypothetical protein IJ00_08020 [Calothrix sp. 336/3]
MLEPLGLQDGGWELVASGYYQAERVGSQYRPIPLIEFPYNLSNHIVAIQTNSDTIRPTWRRSGQLIQVVDLGLSTGQDVEFTQQRLTTYLNRTKLFFLPKISETYQLNFLPLPWIYDLSIRIWSHPDVGNTREYLERIERKIDDMSEYGNV